MTKCSLRADGDDYAEGATAITITLSRRTETLLREQARQLGQDADALADALLRSALEDQARDFEEACAAIAEGLASDPAHDVSLEEYRARWEARRRARN